MRALYLPGHKFEENSSVTIEGDALHHLQVVRVRKEEQVLLLDGNGIKASASVVEILKKSATLWVNKIEQGARTHSFSLAIGLPKKEAFEDILKMATELGINEIYPLRCEYSQYEYAPNERVEKILESALVQSNNLFRPIIHPQVSLEQFLQSFKDEIFFLNARQNIGTTSSGPLKSACALIGPEGGFSQTEEQKILSTNTVKSIHLSTPILRAPTAVAAAIGYLLASSEFCSK